MSIIRRREDMSEKIGVKKMASVQKGSQSSINLQPGPKTTLVSGIVEQLIKSGYKGDLMRNAGMTYAQPDVPEAHNIDDPQPDMTEDLIVDDIDFEKQAEEPTRTNQEEQKKTASDGRNRNAELLEERTKNSQNQIENISKSARVLYGHIDMFISALRVAAENSRDNQRLGYKLENLRRLCVGFVRSVDQQIPHYATSLFVNLEDEENGR
jgi:hypothetical protein